MPTYAAQADMNAFFSAANVTDWADKDRDGSLSADERLAIDAALEAAEAVVDGYLHRAGYAAPFEPVAYTELPPRLKALLRQWTVGICGFHLYAWRGLRDKANPLESLYREMLAQLRAVADGQPLADLERASQVRFGADPADQLSHLKSDAWDW